MHVVGQLLFVFRDNYQVQLPAALFAIDFKAGAVSIAAFMRAPLCVVNERRHQMAGLCQAHPRVQPARAVFNADARRFQGF
jgi:hypothetical protein